MKSVLAVLISCLVLVSHSLGSTNGELPAQELSAQELPAHWVVSFVEEPVFKSKVRVAQVNPHAKETVFLVHGLGQIAMGTWIEAVPVLETKYHVVLIDLPGFGASDMPKGRYTPTHYAQVLHWLYKTYAKGKVRVVGHSMGGAVSLRYASNYPDEVSSVVLVDAAGILSRAAFMKGIMNATVDESIAKQSDVISLDRFGSWAKNIAGSTLEKINQMPDPTAFLYANDYAWNALFKNQPNMNAAMGLIHENYSEAVYTLPHHVTMIWGEKDTVASTRTAQVLHAQLLHSRLHIIENAGHVPMSTHQEVFNQLLLNALLFPEAPVKTQQTPVVDLKTHDSTVMGECQRIYGKKFEGVYESIVISHCKDVVLENVKVNNLKIEYSRVHLKNVHINADTTPVEINQSVVVADNSMIETKQPMKVRNSRLDFAGVHMHSTSIMMTIEEGARMEFSICKLASQAFEGYVHGDYAIRNTVLENHL